MGVACLWREKAMNNLARNTKKMFYATLVKADDVLDRHGDNTGTVKKTYSSPVEFEAHLNAGRSSAHGDLFGINVDYNRTLSSTDTSLPITETSLVWYETEPLCFTDGSADPSSADYSVATKPLVGLNHIVIALKNRVKQVVE